MAGDPTQAHLWTEADVYIAPVGSTIPVNANNAFNASWDLVGLLDPDQGFVQQRNWGENQDYYAWGGILVRTSFSKFKLTMAFTALEDNETVRSVVWPGSTFGELSIPLPPFVMVAFEKREGDEVHRLITRLRAQVSVNGDIVDKESELAKYPLIATIYPDGDGVLFDEQATYAPGS